MMQDSALESRTFASNHTVASRQYRLTASRLSLVRKSSICNTLACTIYVYIAWMCGISVLQARQRSRHWLVCKLVGKHSHGRLRQHNIYMHDYDASIRQRSKQAMTQADQNDAPDACYAGYHMADQNKVVPLHCMTGVYQPCTLHACIVETWACSMLCNGWCNRPHMG